MTTLPLSPCPSSLSSLSPPEAWHPPQPNFKSTNFCNPIAAPILLLKFRLELPTMASAAAASSLVATAASAVSLPRSFGARNGSVGVSNRVLPAGLSLNKAASNHRRRRGVVAATGDNVEEKPTEQKEKEVIQEALEDALRNVKELEEPKQNPLATREGLEERFAVINTGAYECRSCGHTYEEQKGDKTFPVAAGTLFRDLPDDWLCPTCGAAKTYFQTKSVEVAGFAQNQQYGLGGNTLTAGQKSIVIYGSLLAFFALFLSGYLLQ